jgi:general secretion pathway protein M
MAKLSRDRVIALSILGCLLLLCVMIPVLALKARSDAAEVLASKTEWLTRLDASYRKANRRDSSSVDQSVAPPAAWVHAPTAGLASAQLETYLQNIVMAENGSVVSSGVQLAVSRDATDNVRLQTTLNVTYTALQVIVYRLETGTPYVFIDSMTIDPFEKAEAKTSETAMMKVVLDLHALWHPGTK